MKKKNTFIVPNHILWITVVMVVALGLLHTFTPKIELPQSVLNEIATEEASAEYQEIRSEDLDMKFNIKNLALTVYWKGYAVETKNFWAGEDTVWTSDGDLIKRRWGLIEDTLNVFADTVSGFYYMQGRSK